MIVVFRISMRFAASEASALSQEWICVSTHVRVFMNVNEAHYRYEWSDVSAADNCVYMPFHASECTYVCVFHSFMCVFTQVKIVRFRAYDIALPRM